MTLIANLPIGKKLTLVLGGIVLLLTGLSALSLWGIYTTEYDTEKAIQQLTKAQLAEQVAGETSSVALQVARMVINMKVDSGSLTQLLELRKSRKEALEKFQSLADTPKSIQHGADMAQLGKSMIESNERVLTLLNAGQWADAGKEFQTAVARTDALRAKSQEALAWQQYRAARGDESRKQTASMLWMALIIGSLAAVAGAIVGGVVLTRSVALPLAAGITQLGRISQGDLSQDTPAELQRREDEIGALARAMQTMTLSLRAMVQEISGGIHSLALSSAEMMTSSTQMSSGAMHASDRAHSVSAAAEEMSATFVTVAAGMEQTTTNLVHIASATEEMTATISEIAQNSERARSITEQATRQASSVTEQMNQLGVTAREIGKVTEAITQISSQTNLLALNATIEAARAGESGKGFAVVANEIKALAQQTTAATEDIKGRIAAVQSATAVGAAEIGKIGQVILDVSSIVASIATAIEEQSASTREIARNINDASTGLKDANLRVSETSSVSSEIAKDIVRVDHAAGEMASGSDHVRKSAASLAQIADSLKTTVARFQA